MTATVPPDVMAKINAFGIFCSKHGFAQPHYTIVGEELLAAIAAAIEKARRPDTDSMSYRAKPEPFIG